MLSIPAHDALGLAGWLRIPEKQHFSWTLRIEPTPKTVVMVPVKAQSQNRGWTHYHYADLSALSPAQLDLLLDQGWIEPLSAHASAA
ncbi:MAG: hypothetical protein R3C25_13395 [Hyphomonadaceae bacterium]